MVQEPPPGSVPAEEPLPRPVVDHVAVAVRRIEDALPVAVDALGGKPGRAGPGEGFDWHTWEYPGGGRLEILTPTGVDGFLHRFLRAHGPGVHHVTYYVSSLAEACERAANVGFDVVGVNDSNPLWQEGFLHPKSALGLVVQLAQTSEAHEAEGLDWVPPRLAPDELEPAKLVGLRMAAPDAAAARTLFASALLGEVANGERELRFEWPGSAIAIDVEIDPGSPPGPRALVYESSRDLSSFEAPDPTFGVPLARSTRR